MHSWLMTCDSFSGTRIRVRGPICSLGLTQHSREENQKHPSRSKRPAWCDDEQLVRKILKNQEYLDDNESKPMSQMRTVCQKRISVWVLNASRNVQNRLQSYLFPRTVFSPQYWSLVHANMLLSSTIRVSFEFFESVSIIVCMCIYIYITTYETCY